MACHRREVTKTATEIKVGSIDGLARSVSVIALITEINSDGFDYSVRHLH